jgi:hypothetical protein
MVAMVVVGILLQTGLPQKSVRILTMDKREQIAHKLQDMEGETFDQFVNGWSGKSLDHFRVQADEILALLDEPDEPDEPSELSVRDQIAEALKAEYDSWQDNQSERDFVNLRECGTLTDAALRTIVRSGAVVRVRELKSVDFQPAFSSLVAAVLGVSTSDIEKWTTEK